jgi:hypothetical protein
MKKIAKFVFNTIMWALTIYLFVFVFWLMLGTGCYEYVKGNNMEVDDWCGHDLLTQTVRKTHAPLIRLIVPSINNMK